MNKKVPLKKTKINFRGLIVKVVIALALILVIFTVAKAAVDLTVPTRSGVNGTMYTLNDIYNKLTNSTTTASLHTLVPSGAVAPSSMVTLDNIYNQIPAPEQICSSAGGTATCYNVVSCGGLTYCDLDQGYWCGKDGFCHNTCSADMECPSNLKPYCDTMTTDCYGLSLGVVCSANSECENGYCGYDSYIKKSMNLDGQYVCGGLGTPCTAYTDCANSQYLGANFCASDGSGGLICGGLGTSCIENYECYSGFCGGGVCTDGQIGSACDDGGDCGTGVCENNICGNP